MKKENLDYYKVDIKNNTAKYTHIIDNTNKKTKQKETKESDSSLNDVLEKVSNINKKSGIVSSLKSTLFMLFCAFAMIAVFYSLWFLLGSFVISVVLLLLPKETKVILKYSLDQISIDTFNKRLQAMKTLGSMSNIWIENDKNKKLIPTTISVDSSLFVSNINLISISTNNGAYIFLPDTLLGITNESIVTIDYQNVDFDMTKVDYSDIKKIPNDSKIVGYKWKYETAEGQKDPTKANNIQVSVLGFANITMKINDKPVQTFLVSNRQKQQTS